MSAAATQQTPAVPPRPSRPTDKEGSAAAVPKIPPRPVLKRADRSMSPNRDRFAPSPLNGVTIPKATASATAGQHHPLREGSDEAAQRDGSVTMPSVGEEGVEYGAVADGLLHDKQQRPSSPEQTRTVADDLKLHAPKPSLPPASAKQQVMAVTRTDSDRAASFGIGRPTSTAGERTASRNSIKKRPSSIFSAYSDHHTDDEHGIPEIGQRVPMNPHLGDVQAPSPSPGLSPGFSPDGAKRHHGRKLSARGLPPGSYGLHGHGVSPQDKLEKAYYQKHPEALEREQHTPLHDRQNDFAMSSSDLNRLVRDTANRQAAMGTAEFRGTPTDEVAFQASEEYTSRFSSRPASTTPARKDPSRPCDTASPDAEKPIHVDDPRHPEFYSCGDEDAAAAEGDQEYSATILAPDEVNKDPGVQLPAVHPQHEPRDSQLELEDLSSSRPSSRPNSVRIVHPLPDFGSTPLEDVEEYEPLFSEDTKEEKCKHDAADDSECRHHFPSKDIWEDAPSSAHYTATVSTPEVPAGESRRRSSAYHDDRPITPAQAFAQYQEELAEKEATGRSHSFLPLVEDKKPTWIGHQSHLQPKRPPPAKRFPSRDVWEDVPESQLHEAVVCAPPPTDDQKPEIPTRPAKKSSPTPAVPDRLKPRQSSGDDSANKQGPSVSDKPKPQMPPRSTKSSPGDSNDGSSKPKPPVPSRPVGNKIAALQAGFMSDLNKRLQLGPQAPKKQEGPKEEQAAEDKEKAPLSDARKGRARGPQRRAPVKIPAPATAVKVSVPALTFMVPQTAWTIDPDDGDVSVGTETEATPVTETEAEETREPRRAGLGEGPEATDEPLEETQQAEPRQSAREKTAGGAVQKTLAANIAGESVLEATVDDDDGSAEVEDDMKA